MRLGQKAMEALRAEVTGILKEGDELVIAGDIALGGTAFIVEKEKEFLRQYFSEGFLWDAWRGPSLYGVSRNMIEHQKTMEMDAFYSLGEGGVLAGLWKMAEASEIGLFRPPGAIIALFFKVKALSISTTSLYSSGKSTFKMAMACLYS